MAADVPIADTSANDAKFIRQPDFAHLHVHRDPLQQDVVQVMHLMTGEIAEVPPDPEGEYEFELFADDDGFAFWYPPMSCNCSTWARSMFRFEVGTIDDVEHIRTWSAGAWQYGTLIGLLQTFRLRRWKTSIGDPLKKEFNLDYASFFMGRMGGTCRCAVFPQDVHKQLGWTMGRFNGMVWVQMTMLNSWNGQRDRVGAHQHCLLKGIPYLKQVDKRSRTENDPANDLNWRVLDAPSISMQVFVFFLVRWGHGGSERCGAFKGVQDQLSAGELLKSMEHSFLNELCTFGDQQMRIYLTDYQQGEPGWPTGEQLVTLPFHASTRLVDLTPLWANLMALGAHTHAFCEWNWRRRAPLPSKVSSTSASSCGPWPST